MTATYDFIGTEACKQNATFKAMLTWNNSSNAPYNLSNYSAYMDVRSNATAPVSICSLSRANNMLILNSLGTIEILIPESVTSRLLEGSYLYDIIMLENTSGFATRLLEGRFEVVPGITVLP